MRNVLTLQNKKGGGMNDDAWRKFIKLCLEMKNEKELQQFFELFLTYEERGDISRRLLLTKELLSKQLTQRAIAEKLNVSISKITRGSNALKVVSKSYKEKLIKLFQVA
jgi:TrpR family trp operon transcriptional repressor